MSSCDQAMLIEALNDDLISHAMGNDMDFFQTRVLIEDLSSSLNDSRDAMATSRSRS